MIVFPIANVVTIIMNNRVVVMMVFIVLPFILEFGGCNHYFGFFAIVIVPCNLIRCKL